MVRVLKVLPLLLRLVAVLAVALPASAAENEVRIGVLYPLTGSNGPAGRASLYAVEAALDVAYNAYEVNLPLAAGKGLGLPGEARVTLVVADHGGVPERGRLEAERLVLEEKVVALYGAYQSSVTEAASAVAERLGVPFVTGESSAPNLHRRGFHWFFRTGPHDGQYTKVMFEFLEAFQTAREVNFDSVAILHEDSAFGSGSAAVQDELAAERGLLVVAKMAYRADTNFLLAEIEGLKRANPDVLFTTSYSNDARLFLNTAKALGYWPKMLIAQDAGFMDPGFLAAVGKDAEGIISRAPFALDMADRIPQIAIVNRIYKRHSGGQEIFDPPIRSFIGFLVLLDAIRRAGAAEPEAIREALRNTYIPAEQLPMPWFNIRFGPDGQNNGAAAILVQYQGGHYFTIYPFRFAARQVIYPMPSWHER